MLLQIIHFRVQGPQVRLLGVPVFPQSELPARKSRVIPAFSIEFSFLDTY